GSGTLRRSDLWVLPLVGERKPSPFLETPSVETQGQFAPDSHLIAYVSDESNQMEVYVAPFLTAGRKQRVSNAGGGWPRWRRDGKELFYLSPDNILMSVKVNGTTEAFNVEAARPMFGIHPRPMVRNSAFPYDVSSDGQRFLVNTFVEDATTTSV